MATIKEVNSQYMIKVLRQLLKDLEKGELNIYTYSEDIKLNHSELPIKTMVLTTDAIRRSDIKEQS